MPLEPPAFIIEQAAPAPDLPSLIFSRHFVGQGDLVRYPDPAGEQDEVKEGVLLSRGQ